MAIKKTLLKPLKLLAGVEIGSKIEEVINDSKLLNYNDLYYMKKEKAELKQNYIGRIGDELASKVTQKNWTTQKDLVKFVVKLDFKQLYDNADEYHKVRLKGCCAHAATAWIHANPLPLTRFTNEDFKIAAHIWLGIPLVDREYDCRFCGTTMNIYGAHAATCRSGSSMIKRHNSIKNYLYSQMKVANYTCVVENKYLDHD